MSTWRDDRACRSGDVMFDPLRRREAKAICAGCPVVAVCLWSSMAFEANEANGAYRYGVAGNTTPAERRRLGEDLDDDAIASRLRDAVVAWKAGFVAPTVPIARPMPAAVHAKRRCAQCSSTLEGRRQSKDLRFCSTRCRNRYVGLRRHAAARASHRQRAADPAYRERRAELQRQRRALKRNQAA